MPINRNSWPLIKERLGLWVFAVRDGFITVLPITFFGVLAVLIENLPWPAYQAMLSEVLGAQWRAYLTAIVNSTHGVFAIALSVAVAVLLNGELTKRSPEDEELPALPMAGSALVNFMLCLSTQGPIELSKLGHEGTLLGLMVGVASAELLRLTARLFRSRWWTMPYDTGVILYHAIRLTPPVIVAGVIALTFMAVMSVLVPFTGHLLAPVAAWAVAQSAGVWMLSATATLLNQAFWFIGIHGAHVIEAYASDLFVPPGLAYDGARVWTPLLDTFVLLGGAGATLGLLLAILLVVRDGPPKRLAHLSIVPALFNINEVLLYGLPIILNRLFLLPFVVVPLLLTLLAVAAAQSGFIVMQTVRLPWTTPPFVSGWLLTGSWHGVALQVVGLAVSTAVYLPFVRRAEAQRQALQSRLFADATQAILAKGQRGQLVVRRRDGVGMIARGLLADLKADLARNALSMAYQPKHDRAGRVVGVEALLRWRHALHGPISPAVAVNLAEDSGDIHELGLWVLDHAFACKASWNALGFGALTMSINLSPVQLTNPALPQWVALRLQHYQLDPRTIELEITESAEIPSSEVVDDILQKLTQTGVHLSMDDFGMGYSSLLYMRRFHVHAIKIDGSLTRDVLTNATNADIIRTIVSLGQAQKTDVVVEFVETLAQREALARMGCNLFQGHFHSAALSEEQCVDYFKRHIGQDAPGWAEFGAV